MDDIALVKGFMVLGTWLVITTPTSPCKRAYNSLTITVHTRMSTIGLFGRQLLHLGKQPTLVNLSQSECKLKYLIDSFHFTYIHS